MMRRVYILLFLTLAFLSCGPSDEELMQEAVVNAVTAISAGDTDRYLQYVDFGEEVDSLHVSLLRTMLARHKTIVDSKGGVVEVSPLPSSLDNDSLVNMAYTIKYGDGTEERKVAPMVKKAGQWKVIVK